MYSTGIIFEGVPATGKSTIIKRLLKRDEILNREFMPFFTYGEEITQRVLEAKHNRDEISKEDNLTLLDDILTPLEKYNDYYQQRGWSPEDQEYNYAFILERFHLTHANYFNHITWDDLLEIDSRLAKLKAKLSFFRMNRDVMAERIIYSRADKWRRYISRFGKTDKEIIDYYYQQQERKMALVEKSKLESIIIDTSKANWNQIVEEVIRFWGV